MEYKFKRVEEHGYIITEEGHTMFPEDVKMRLDELNYLKKKNANSGYPLLGEVLAEFENKATIIYNSRIIYLADVKEILSKYFASHAEVAAVRTQ